MPAEKAPAYQRYPNDYLTDPKVVAMTLEEEGAYNRLMDYCWKEGSLPDDVAELAAMCKNVSKKKMEKIWARVGRCFKPHPTEAGRVVHKRLDEERQRQAEWRDRQAKHGRDGAKKRWGGDRVPTETPMGSDSSSSSSSSASTDKTSPSPLRAWLGDQSAAVERMAQSAKHGESWEAGIFALYGPEGTDSEVWKIADTGTRMAPDPGKVAIAIDRYAAEGKIYNNILFRRYLEKVINERNGNGGGKHHARATGTEGRSRPDQSSRRRKGANDN